jgi:hypothetical protein
MPKTASILGQQCLLGFLISWSCSVALAVPAEPTGSDQHQGAAQMHHGNSHAVAAKAPKPIPDIESGRIKTGLPFRIPP